MKTLTKIMVFMLCAGILGACASKQSRQQEYNRRNARKIYLTEKDYMDELGEEARKEHRAAPPAAESEYIFNAVPETDKAIYFFDERRRPKVPGNPEDDTYKKEKRLWEKPKRYSADEYYAMQGDAGPQTEPALSDYDY